MSEPFDVPSWCIFTPCWADTPWVDIPRADTPLPSAYWDTLPLSSACWDTHPHAQCMLVQAGDTHITGMHSC